MASLLDTIRQNNPGLQKQGFTNETGKLQTLLRAKSGKNVAGPAVSSSSMGEQAAVSQTNNLLQNQVAPAAELQSQQLQQQARGQEQQRQQQTAEIAQNRKFDSIETRLKTNEILADLEQKKGQLDFQRDRAALEQAGTNLRLQNQKYVADLQRAGNMSRLNNQLGFQEALVRSTLGDNQKLLETKLGNKSILDVNDREYKMAMANMDINTAYDMFKNDMAAQKQRALYSGAGALATAGIGAYGTMSEASDKESYYTSGAGANDTTYEASKYRPGNEE